MAHLASLNHSTVRRTVRCNPGPNRGMRLTVRLLLLVLACLLPTVMLAVFIGLDQRAERKAEIEASMLRQAEWLDGDMDNIASGARILLAAAARFASVQKLDPSCSEPLAGVQRDLPRFAALAVLDLSGRLVCASARGLALAGAPSAASWVTEALAAGRFGTGTLAEAPGVEGPFLPFYMPLAGPDGVRRGALVAGLDLGWLTAHLREARVAGPQFLRDSVLTVADRTGVILARDPDSADHVGKRLAGQSLSSGDARAAGVGRSTGADGVKRLSGYVRGGHAGLLVTAGALEPDLMANVNRASIRDALLTAAATLAAVGLALLSGRRFIGRPTAALVQAAQSWRAGDAGSRAHVPEARSEFGQIAAAWNELADALQQHEAELRQQAQLLETRVEERTRALTETTRRLQVEVAERQQTEAALVQAQKLQTMGQLAGGIAHDFNNLLATILGSLELIGRGLDPAHIHQRAMIERASEAVQRGAQLTSRLLAFSRRKPLAVRATDLNKLVGDLAALLATTTLGRRIRVRMELDPALPSAMAEPSQVEAAILNLALNARDAMPGGGVLTISTACETLTDPLGPEDPPPGEYVRVTLQDTGDGMTAEVARRAFEPFFTTKGASGSGLGLSQVLALTRELGGGVRLQTTPDMGTSVTLLLPRAHAAAAPPTTDTRRRSARAWNVLLVDDDATVRQVTADMLAQLGCRVRQAADGTAGLRVLHDRADGPDLLVVDFAMPGMNGLALAAAARRDGFRGPVVLVTGYAEAAEPEPGELVPEAVLHKPFTNDELARTLTRLAERPERRADVALQSAD